MSGALVSVGRWGENLAVQHVLSNGYHVIACNVRPGNGHAVRGEIDIIARLHDTICIIEVKTLRRVVQDFIPAMNVTLLKQRQIVRLTELWLCLNPLPEKVSLRFDVIAVQLVLQGPPKLSWMQGAFLAE